MEAKLHYSIVTGAQAREVICRMVSGGTCLDTDSKQVDVFLRFLDRYGIDSSRQAVAKTEDDRIVGYCLCLVNPGATGSIFLPETYPDLGSAYSFDEVGSEVLKTLTSQMQAWDLAILQAMVKDEQSELGRVFRKGGFLPICRLEIMQTAVGAKGEATDGEGITWEKYETSRSEAFADTILQTYEGSRDCPCLTGLRTGDEILVGHRNSGIFEEAGWWILCYQGRPAGVILLNSTEEDLYRLELVYMGLSAWARGKGLGRVLLSWGFECARRLGKKVLRLSVDCDNAPAIRLYRSFGFQPIGNQSVLAVLNTKRRRDK
jgi:GNAT superfamily N-acetyltransferase